MSQEALLYHSFVEMILFKFTKFVIKIAGALEVALWNVKSKLTRFLASTTQRKTLQLDEPFHLLDLNSC